ncbi:MAG: AAA family ATPase [Acidobacteria bacterium]|nr:AAA family ATPase [Acidobacteriota bacterium]
MDLSLSSEETCFLWGPRQTGKSTLLKTRFPNAITYDLLLSTQYRRLVSDPSILRQECEARGLNRSNQKDPIIIDEVQKIPELLDEIHWLIENRGLRFILSGSSPRKVKRSHANLLGGRAVRYQLFPLIYPEIPNLSLHKALNSGLLPRHYLAKSPAKLLEAYVTDYLKEEIAAEAVARNIPAFNRFLEAAAITNSEMVNFNNIANDCGVSAPTVKGYFQILEDTLIGKFIPAYQERAKRRLIRTPRFLFFDMGIVAHLTRRGEVQEGSELFGKAFTHFITLEVLAHSSYSDLNYPVTYWRTVSQFEVDLILGNELAVEIKSTDRVMNRHLKDLRALKEDHTFNCILVSLDPAPRKTPDGILILPWQDFLERLWSNKIIK